MFYILRPILSLDPSTVATGYAVLLSEDQLITYGCIKPLASHDLGKRLNFIRKYVWDLVRAHNPIAIISEDQFQGKNTHTLMVLREIVGVIRELASQEKIDFQLIVASRVKKAVTGDGRAGKDAVREAVIKRFNIPDLKSNDIGDAIAVGTAYFLRTKAQEGSTD